MTLDLNNLKKIDEAVKGPTPLPSPPDQKAQIKALRVATRTLLDHIENLGELSALGAALADNARHALEISGGLKV